MRNLIIGVCVGMIALHAVSMPDIMRRQIESAFALTNSPIQVELAVHSLYTNVWRNLNGNDPGLAREVQYSILTNACQFRSLDLEYWAMNGMTERRSWFYDLYTFRPGGTDLGYVNQCADFLGIRMSIDMVSGDAFTSRRQREAYEDELKDSRDLLLKRYGKMVQRYECLLSPSDLPSFRTNIITRARLTPEEQRILWPVE